MGWFGNVIMGLETYQIPARGLTGVAQLVVGGEDDEDLVGSHVES